MKRLFVIVPVIVAILAFAQPAFAAPPFTSPPQTFPMPPGGTLSFPEVGMEIQVFFANGTYTPHIVNPAGNPNVEESWFKLTGSGSGVIRLLAGPIQLPFSVPQPTTMKVTVHHQTDQPPIITIVSSAPVTLGIYQFTTAQIRILPAPDFFEIIHVNSVS